MTLTLFRAAANGSAARVSTPLLQLVMETIWQRERAEGSHELRLSTLQELHGVRMIVDTHLEKALSGLGSHERRTAVDLFDHLVTPSGGKIAESVPDLAKRTGRDEAEVGGVLDSSMIPASSGRSRHHRAGPQRFRRYEIFHDVLAPAINHTIAARDERRRARRLRRFAALALALLIVMLGVAGTFAYLLHQANTEKLTAESRELAADADVNTTRDPELSALLALQAWRLQHTSQAEEALRRALPELQAVRTFPVGTTVYLVAFDPADPNKVAGADRYGGASIWDVKTGHRLLRMSLGGFNATGAAGAVAFNPAGTEVAVGFADGHVALFDARSGKKLQSPTLSGGPTVDGLAFLSTGQLAIATQQGLALWQLQNGSPCCQVLSSTPAYSIAAGPGNPGEIAVTTASGPVIWTISGPGKPRQQQLPEGSWSANDAAFSPDGSQLATADSDGKVRVYSVVTRKTVMTLDAGDAQATSVAFSPDGSLIAAGYSSGMTRVWDASTRLQLTQLAGHAARIYAIRFSRDGSQVVTGSDDGTVRVWYSRPRELQAEFAGSSANSAPSLVVGAQYISRDRIIVLDGSGNLYAYTPAGRRLAVISPAEAAVYTAAWDTAGTRIVTIDYAGTVDVWQATDHNYTQMHLFSTVSVSGARNAAMSPNGSQFTVVTSDNYYKVQLRSAQTGKLLRTLDAANSVSTVAFSPDGRQIVAADYNGQVEVWDAATGHRRLLGVPGPPITDIEFNKSGSEFVAASLGGTVTVWAAPGDRPLTSFTACPAPGTAAPSPDGSKIVVACGDGSALVFDAATGQQLTVLPATTGGTVSNAGFSFDGNSIITVVDSEGTGAVQVWNAELANPSPSVIAQIAGQRITRPLTQAERTTYLAGIG